MAAEQANLGGSNTGLESVHTPWLTHKIKSFITENLATHSKEKANTNNQKKSHHVQRERVLEKGASRGKSHQASPLPFLQLDNSQTSWHDDLESAERDGSNTRFRR